MGYIWSTESVCNGWTFKYWNSFLCKCSTIYQWWIGVLLGRKFSNQPSPTGKRKVRLYLMELSFYFALVSLSIYKMWNDTRIVDAIILLLSKLTCRLEYYYIHFSFYNIYTFYHLVTCNMYSLVSITLIGVNTFLSFLHFIFSRVHIRLHFN